MATIERTSLEDAIATRSSQLIDAGKEPVVAFVKRGDYLSVHFVDEQYVAETIDGTLTVYRSVASGELIGCKITGVSRLATSVASRFQISDGDLDVDLLLNSGVGTEYPQHFQYDLDKLRQRVRAFHLTVPLSSLSRAA